MKWTEKLYWGLMIGGILMFLPITYAYVIGRNAIWPIIMVGNAFQIGFHFARRLDKLEQDSAGIDIGARTKS